MLCASRDFNNKTNFDDDGKLKAVASPVMLNTGGEEPVESFTSTDKVMYFDIEPGSYVLVEDAIPVGTEYKPSANIPFTVDVYGVIKVNGERVNYVKMVDEPPFKIVFHENKPGGTPADKQKSFKVVEKMDLNDLSGLTLSRMFRIVQGTSMFLWAGIMTVNLHKARTLTALKAVRM